jgi:hypothetical protein
MNQHIPASVPPNLRLQTALRAAAEPAMRWTDD